MKRPKCEIILKRKNEDNHIYERYKKEKDRTIR
jgi:hypothetical protein